MVTININERFNLEDCLNYLENIPEEDWLKKS